MTDLLEVDRLTAGYGAAPVLHDVALTVGAGRIVAVLGANGAGKTTLLRTLSGLLPASAGRIVFDGIDLRGVKVERMVRHGIAHVPEGRGVVTELTVEENLRLGGLWRKRETTRDGLWRKREPTRDGLWHKREPTRDGLWRTPETTRDGLSPKRGRKRTELDDIYDLFPALADRRSHLGHQLSGGERQMLAIGRALAAKPRLLLLDEPSLGLAPKITAQIMGLLRDLRDRTGLAVLLVEQNVRSALSIADEGIVLNLGRVAARERADKLAADTDLRHAYLGF